MSGHKPRRRRVSSTLLTLQPLEPRCLMAADAGFAASLAAGPRLTVAQAQAQAAAGSQAAEQAGIRRDLVPEAAAADPRQQAVAVGQGLVREAVPGAVTTPQVATETFGIDALTKDQAARQAATDRGFLGAFAPGAGESGGEAAFIERLNGLPGGSNRDRQSDTTRGYGAGITTDPGAMLAGARSGLASLGGILPGSDTDGIVRKETTANPDGSLTTRCYDRAGHVVKEGTWVRHQDGTTTQTEVFGGSEIYTTTHTSRDGLTFTQVTSIRNLNGGFTNSLSIGRRASADSAWSVTYGTDYCTPEPDRVPPPLRNVDPDSSYGQGSGWVGGPGLKEQPPAMIRARQQAFAGFGPGARSGNGGERMVAPPRVNVPGSLVGQPDPTDPRGGGGNGPGYQGYNPNDFVNPPR